MQQTDIRILHERMGKVSSQPINVTSFTNKRLTINYRVPIERLRQLVPDCLEADEIGNTGLGMISQCVCDFRVTKFGLLPIPKTHTNEMLCLAVQFIHLTIITASEVGYGLAKVGEIAAKEAKDARG